ncbi:MAG: hypothetical protein ACO1RX_19875 [Candidatus Sericytochromatia bacterium]
MRRFASLLALISLTTLTPALAQAPPPHARPLAWEGDWQWQDPHSATANHYLRLKGPLKQPSGAYVGNEIAEGILYFKMPLSKLNITAQQTLSFEIGPHGLTRQRLTLNAPNLPIDASSEGASGVRFRFQGKLQGKDLLLKCQADDNVSCPSATMRFVRLAKK